MDFTFATLPCSLVSLLMYRSSVCDKHILKDYPCIRLQFSFPLFLYVILFSFSYTLRLTGSNGLEKNLAADLFREGQFIAI